MDKKLTILTPFFNQPTAHYHIRELARKLDMNHASVRNHLNKLVDDGILQRQEGKLYVAYKAVIDTAFLNLKLYHNLEQLRMSGLVEKLEEKYAYPTIVLFGSYAQARDDQNSDIDICIITEAESKIKTTRFGTISKKPVNLHIFPENKWKELITQKEAIVNSIVNGIVLSGELEISNVI